MTTELDRAIAQRKLRAKSVPIARGILKAFDDYGTGLTVRQVYYQLASFGLVPLCRSGYRQAQNMTMRLRELDIIPWGWFADRARERIQRAAWDDASEFADAVAQSYRKDLWQTQDEHVEFWLEKDALSGFVSKALHVWGNPLCVVRGFSSATFVYECAQVLKEIDKPKYVYYLGDHDPAGLNIELNVQERLSEFGADFYFERIAVTLEDIERHSLMPLTAKKTDSRYADYVRRFGTTTVEIDALPPDILKRRILRAVNRHVDIDEWKRLQRVEAVEKQSIRSLAERMRGLEVAR